MKRILCSLVIALSIALASEANSITYSGASGILAASVKFDNDTLGYLTVTLTNTSAFSMNDPADVLTGVFFSLNPGATVSNTGGSSSAKVAPGSW